MAIPADHAGYRIEVFVNGNPLNKITMQRTHKADVRDRVTLTGTGDVRVKRGDIITVFLTVEPDPQGNKHQYQVQPSGSNLTIERMPIY